MAQMVQLVLFLTLFLHASLSFSPSNTNKNLTKINQSARALLQASSKLSNSAGFAAEIQFFGEDYLVSLAIGTPPMPILLIPSTGSDLIWTQSLPCHRCFNQTKSNPIYDPKKSSSFSKLPCRNTLCQASQSFQCTPDCKYKHEYASGTTTQGLMGIETITIGSTKVDGIAFGSGNSNTLVVPHGSGVLGLNREPLSLIIQLGIGRFSYCLPSSKGSKGRILFGSEAGLKDNSKATVLSTRLAHNPSDPSLYYVTLKGLTVGKTRLPIPENTFEIKKDGTGGANIVAGSFFPTLEKTAFRLLKEEFRSQLKLNIVVSSDGFDACYSLPLGQSVDVPKLIYHFDGADLELPVGNYMLNYVDKQMLCLYILESKDGRSSFGDLHQQDIQMIFDLEDEVLSIVPNSQCEDI
ncbi:putative nepenthesin [Dioscorea sansibarensis]